MGIFTNIFKRNTQEKNVPTEIPFSPFGEALIFGTYQVRSALFLSAVYSALSLISDQIASLNVEMKQIADGKKTVIDNHPVSRLFYTSRLNKHTLLHNIVWDFLLRGNAFVYIKRDRTGTPVALKYLERGDVTINYDKLNDTVTYNVANHSDIPTIVQEKDMMNFVRDSVDGVNGRGFMYFARNVIKLSDASEQAAEEFFSSGCQLSGILKFKGRINDAQKKNIRSAWQQIHGPGGSGLGILEGDSDYQPITQNSADSQLLETRQFSVIEIARFFHISPILLCDLSHSSYSDIESASIEFVTHALLPIISVIQEEIDKKLLNDSPTLYSNLDETTLMKGNKNSQADYVTKLVNGGIITVNEARRTLDYNSVDEEQCDKLIIPYTDIQQNTIGNTTDIENNEENND